MALYKIFNPETDIVENAKQVISSGLWSAGLGTLITYFTQSAQSQSTGEYYYDVYKTNPSTDSVAEIQFGVAYGHIEGSGSIGGTGIATGNRATAAIYSQFRNLLLNPNVNKFTFAGSITSNDIYVISFNRARMREKIDPGNWELRLSGSAGYGQDHGIIKLIDDSGATSNPSVNQGGRVFNVISGSIASGTAITKTVASSQPGGGYGLFYPDMGIIILNPTILDATASFGTDRTSNSNQNNAQKLYKGISGSLYFAARREENISSTHYFCRAFNQEFNFSNNPTFFTASDGSFTNPSFFKDPKTYVTAVGLFNDNNELLAIAKVSKPLLKSFSREINLKVKLDFVFAILAGSEIFRQFFIGIFS